MQAMIHYTNSDVPTTPPRDHRSSQVPLQATPGISINDYRKVVSPFQAAGYKEPQSATKTRERSCSKAGNKEQVRQTLQERFKRVFESPAGKKGGSDLTPRPASKSILQPELRQSVTVDTRRAEAAPMPARREVPEPRIAKRSQSGVECKYRQLPKEYYQPQAPRPSASTRMVPQPRPMPEKKKVEEPLSSTQSPIRAVSSVPKSLSPEIRPEPVAAPEQEPQPEPVRSPERVPEPEPAPERTPRTPLSECSKCSGARSKGMEYICNGCENHELYAERKHREKELLEESRRPDPALQKAIEEMQKKQLEEHALFRQRMGTEMKAALLEASEKKAKEAEEKKQPHSTTILRDNFGLDYAKYRAVDREKDLEKMRTSVAAQMLERQIEETAKKDAAGRAGPAREIPTAEQLIAEYEKKRGQQREDLLAQMNDQKTALSAAKQRELEMDRAAIEASMRYQERMAEEQRARLKTALDNTRAEIGRTLEMSERKKRDELAQKAREKEEMEGAEQRHRDAVAMFSAERNAQREKMAKELQDQIMGKKGERERERAKDIEFERKREEMVRARMVQPGTCPHGKKYICAYCHRSYPRQQLTKRPMKL